MLRIPETSDGFELYRRLERMRRSVELEHARAKEVRRILKKHRREEREFQNLMDLGAFDAASYVAIHTARGEWLYRTVSSREVAVGFIGMLRKALAYQGYRLQAKRPFCRKDGRWVVLVTTRPLHDPTP